MTPVMNLQVIPDEDLLARSKEWRLRALRGDKDARGIAHELECELCRRLGVSDILCKRDGLQLMEMRSPN